MKYRKYIIMILIIIAFLGLIWSFKIIINEENFINVNNENKEAIKETLKNTGIRTAGIRKIGIGQGWHRHSMHIYYYFGITEELFVGEGTTYNIPGKIYSMDSTAIIIGCISFLALFVIFIYEIKRKI